MTKINSKKIYPIMFKNGTLNVFNVYWLTFNLYFIVHNFKLIPFLDAIKIELGLFNHRDVISFYRKCGYFLMKRADSQLPNLLKIEAKSGQSNSCFSATPFEVKKRSQPLQTYPSSVSSTICYRSGGSL